MNQATHNIKRIACVGTGTIGAGWAAYFLSRGFEVLATDPGDTAEDHLHHVIDQAWPVLSELGLSRGADRDRLTFTPDLEQAVSGADFVQESAPDREDLKIDLFSRIDALAPPHCVIASSTSEFLPSRLASACNHPGRCIVGHPFAPSYLMPLVEVVGGDKTDNAVMDLAMDFYAAIGKKPLRLKKEIDSFIANRLQDVVFEEAISLVEQGICSFQDVDDAMCDGPGLRWAFAGPAMCYHLGGGSGGITAMIEQFGFEGNEAAEKDLLASVQNLSGGQTMDRLESWRDHNLLAMMRLLRHAGDH